MIEWLPSGWNAFTSWLTNRDIRRRLDECEEDRRKLWEQDRANKAKIAALEEMNHIGSMVIDSSGCIDDVTIQMASLSGYEMHELLRLRMYQLLTVLNDEQHKWITDFWNGLHRTTRTMFESELLCKSGLSTLVTVKFLPVASGSGDKLRVDLRRR